MVLTIYNSENHIYAIDGSKIRVQYTEYEGSNKFGDFVGLDLQAVQVLDLVEYRSEDGAELLDLEGGEEF